MGDLVNLRQARKRKQRNEKAKKADENRAMHGRTRHERTLSDAEKQAAQKHLDAHQRTGPVGDGGSTGDKDADTPVNPPVSDSSDKPKSPSAKPENVVSIFSRDKSSNDPA